MKEGHDIFSAVENGDAAAVKQFIDAGADVDVRDKWGNTPIHYACELGHTDVVRLLLKRGADVNECDEISWTPLHVACEHGYANLVRLLLERGAETDTRTKSGSTPLDRALRLKTDDPHREEIIDLFRKHAPDLVMETWCTQSPGGMR